VLKNFFTYVDDLDMMLDSTRFSSNNNTKLTAKEFKEVLNKITGDKVSSTPVAFSYSSKQCSTKSLGTKVSFTSADLSGGTTEFSTK
jgi:hypothetical protein